MKKKALIPGFVLGAVCALTAASTLSQDGGYEMPPIVAELHAATEQPMQPSSFHRRLDPFIGTWNFTMKMFFQGPEGPAVEVEGRSTIEWILDGRFTQETSESVMMMPDGAGGMIEMPYKSLQLIGYNNYRNQYQATSIGSLDTQMLVATGSCNPEGTEFTYYGIMDEPALRVTGRTVKYQTRRISDDEHIVRIYDLHVSDDYKVVEIEYHRAK